MSVNKKNNISFLRLFEYLLLSFLIIPTLLVFHWQLNNKIYSLFDGSMYLTQSLNLLFSTIEQSSFLDSLKVFLTRDTGKPVIINHIAAVFLMFFGNSSLIATMFFSVVNTFLTTFITYHLFKLYTDIIAASVGALFLMSSMWYFAVTQAFSSESFQFVASLSFVYFWFRTSGNILFNAILSSLFAFFSLAIRPEGALVLIAILVFQKLIEYRAKFIDVFFLTLPLVFLAIIPSVELYLFLNKSGVGISDFVQFLLIVSSNIVLYLKFRHQFYRFKFLILFISLFSIISLLWFIPRWDQLVSWVWGCSVGELIQSQYSEPPSKIKFIKYIYNYVIGFRYLIILAISFVMLLISFGFKQKKILNNKFSYHVFVLLLCLPIFILLQLSTMSEDPRYLLISAFLFFWSLLVFLFNFKVIKNIVLVFCFTASIFAFILIASYSFGYQVNGAIHKFFEDSWLAPSVNTPEPNIDLYAKLRSDLSNEELNGRDCIVFYTVFQVSSFEGNHSSVPILELVARENKGKTCFYDVSNFSYQSFDEFVNKNKIHIRGGVLLGPVDFDRNLSDIDERKIHFAYVNKLYQEALVGNLDVYGFQYINTYEVRSLNNTKMKYFLIRKK